MTEEVGRKRRCPGTGVMDGVSHHGGAENRTRSSKCVPILSSMADALGSPNPNVPILRMVAISETMK